MAAPAQASYHNETVNEVMPNGSGGKQFVELRDTVGEEFPDPTGTYRLVVYDAAGTRLDHQLLFPSDLAGAGTNPLLFANEAMGMPSLTPLKVTLPTTAGKVCFTTGAMLETAVNCVDYRCPGSRSVPLDTSVQPSSPGSLAFATPTPGAANAAASGPAACPSTVVLDKTKPKLKLGGSTKQKISKLALLLKSNEAGRATVSGSAKIGKKKIAIKTVKNLGVKAGRTAKIKLRFSAARAAALRAAIAQGTSVKLGLSISVKDVAGNTARTRRTIKLTG